MAIGLSEDKAYLTDWVVIEEKKDGGMMRKKKQAAATDNSAVGGGGWRIVLGRICPFRCRKGTHPGTRNRPARVSEVQGHCHGHPPVKDRAEPSRKSTATEFEVFYVRWPRQCPCLCFVFLPVLCCLFVCS